MAVQPSQFEQVMAWIKNNEIVLGLLLSAIVITMPEALPHWKDSPQWMWGWVRDALKTFMNFRHSGAPITDLQHKEQQALIADQPVKLPAPPTVVTTVVTPPTGPQQLNG
jgi:hypothetical protein